MDDNYDNNDFTLFACSSGQKKKERGKKRGALVC